MTEYQIQLLDFYNEQPQINEPIYVSTRKRVKIIKDLLNTKSSNYLRDLLNIAPNKKILKENSI